MRVDLLFMVIKVLTGHAPYCALRPLTENLPCGVAGDLRRRRNKSMTSTSNGAVTVDNIYDNYDYQKYFSLTASLVVEVFGLFRLARSIHSLAIFGRPPRPKIRRNTKKTLNTQKMIFRKKIQNLKK